MATRVNVSEIVDNSRLSAFQITTFVLCGLCLLMDGFDAQVMGYVAPVVSRELHIPAAALGRVLAASPFGVMIGSLLFSMLADKLGRRPVLIFVTAYYAILTVISALATTAGTLLVIRVIAGVGLGGIMPNAVALCGEFSPKQSRVTVMMVVANCFSAGAAVCGFVAAWLIPNFGWRSVFYFGGAVPLLISLVMLLMLPESLQYLALRGKNPVGLRKWLKRVEPAAPTAGSVEYVVNEQPQKGVPWVHLFHEGRAVGTAFLWVINFMNLLNLYFLSNWLPSVVTAAGYSTQTAALVTASLQLAGTVGAFALGWGVHKVGFVPILATGFTLGCINIAMIGQPGLSLTMLFVVVCIAGLGVVGGQAGVNALAATYYPTDLRSTGVGAGLGIGRIGAIVGPLVAGELLARHWSAEQLFYTAAITALISAIVMVGMRWVLKPFVPAVSKVREARSVV